ncbi:MAG: HTTM domain-containing protein [Bythopirellula sp.]|nr:HTTM domain-containing protein [Bythopirellula sp.]
MDRLSSLRRFGQTLFALDLRSLACLRIGLAFLILVDLLLRSRDLVAFYTDQGLLARHVVTTGFNQPAQWSLHFMNGTPLFQGLLFLVAGIAAVMMLVGYQTRLATLVSWLLLVSLHTRNPLILNAGDKYLALLTFWGIFLPLGEIWSLDAKRRDKARGMTVISLATFALYLQIALLYVSTALLKHGQEAWQTGEAIRLALSKDFIVTQWGQRFLAYPELLQELTRATLYLELLAPLAILLSRGWLRVVVLAALILFHLLLAACFTIGLFPYVCIVGFLAFLPAKFWECVLKQPAGSAAGFQPPVPTTRLARAGELSVLLLALVVSLWRCVNSVTPTWTPPEVLRQVGYAFRWNQSWQMFTDLNPHDEGWFVFHAQFVDGTSVDLLTGATPVSYKQPELVSATFPNMRWRKLCTNMRGKNVQLIATYLGEYLLVERDRRHHDVHKLSGLEINFLKPDKAPTINSNTIEVLGETFATTIPLSKEVLYEWRNEARKYQDIFIRD